MKKLIILFSALFLSNQIYANNAFYISVSSQIARKQNMEMVANNAANINTIGYEEDALLLRASTAGKSVATNTQFVETKGMYKTGELGPLKNTNNPLDVSVAENHQYLKIMTPKGQRLIVSDTFFRNQDGLVVNANGHALLSTNDDGIEIPVEARSISVLSNGSIIADDEEVGRIGIFFVEDRNTLIKEGEGLYKATVAEIPLDDFTLISGALRGSNVNPTRIIAQTIESQRAFSGATSFISEIGELEKQAVTKILKTQ